MKNLTQILTLCLFLFSIFACNEAKPKIEKQTDSLFDDLSKEEKLLARHWILEMVENKTEPKKTLDYKTQKVQIVLHMESTGYFIMYDSIVDAKLLQSGLPKTEIRNKGQWSYTKAGHLHLTYVNDLNKKEETFAIDKLDANALQTHGLDKNTTIFRTYRGL